MTHRYDAFIFAVLFLPSTLFKWAGKCMIAQRSKNQQAQYNVRDSIVSHDSLSNKDETTVLTEMQVLFSCTSIEQQALEHYSWLLQVDGWLLVMDYFNALFHGANDSYPASTPKL